MRIRWRRRHHHSPLLITGLNTLCALLFTFLVSACNPVGQTTIGQNFYPGVTLSNSNSTVTVSNSQVASGSSVGVTVDLRDTNGVAFVSTLPTVSLQASGGTSTGTFSSIANNGDGSYSATFTGLNTGTATIVQAIVNGQILVSALPTVTVTSGGYSLSQSVLSVSSNTVTAGSGITVTLTAVDGDGNQLQNGGLAVSFSNSGGTSTGAFSAVTDNGNGTYTAIFTGDVGGTPTTIHATIQGSAITSTLPSVTVTGGSVSSISVSSGNSQSAVAGSALSLPLVAIVKDTNNNPLAGISVAWAVTAGGGSVSSCTTTTNGSGQAQCTLNLGTTAGTNTVTATIPGLGLIATFTETGTVGSAASITVNFGNNQNGTAGSPLAGSLIAIVKDSNSNPVSGVTVTWAVTAGGGSDSSCTTTTNSSGLVQCTFTTGTTAGTNTVTATASGVSTPATFTETGTVGSAATIAVSSGNSLSATAGSAIASPLVAIVKDSNSNPVSGVTVAWAVTAGGGSDSSCTTTTNSSGLVQCTFTTGTIAGANTVTATASGVATPATFTETGTVGSASSIIVSSGNSLSATAGSVISSPLVAIVKDSNSNPVSGVTVTWAVTAGGGSDSSCTTTTNSSGLVQCTLTTGTTAGTNTVTATASGIATPATFTETGTVGSAATIAVSSGNSLSATAGSAIASPLIAIVKDSNSNPVSGVTVTWAVTAGGGSDSSCTTTTNSSGLVQCTFTTGTTAGTNTVTATASGVSTPATFTETGTVGSASSIIVSSGNSLSATAGSVISSPLVAIVKDSNSNPVSGVTVTWAVTAGGGSDSSCTTTTNSSGLVQCTLTTGTTAGTNTVTATASGIATPATFTETGTVGSAATIAVSSGNSLSATAGSAIASPLIAIVKDSNSNPVSGVTVTWAVTAGSGSDSSCTTTTNSSGLVQCTLTTGTTAGTNTVTATASGVATPATFTETGTAGTATNISVNFGNNQSATAGSPLAGSLIAIVKDSNANPVSGVTVTWAVTAGGGSDSSCTTTTNSSGLVQCILTTGTTAGTNTVTATASGVATPATFTETGTVGSASSIIVSSGNSLSATAGSAISSPLVAIVKDSNSNPVSGVTVTWAVTAGGGSDSSCTTTTNSSGLVQCTLTTGTTAGTNTVTATASGVATPATFTETGTVGSAASISVSSGNSLSATAGSAIGSALVAIVKDSNSNPVSGVTVAWAVTAGGGSDSSCTTTTNSSGLVQCTLTTGTTAGTNTITATASGVVTPATFTETGTAGTAATIAVSSGNSLSATAGSAIASPLIAIVKDSNSNPVSGVTVAWAVTAGGGSDSSCTTTTNSSGLVQCTFTTGTTAGTNTVTATASGVATPATFTETGTAGTATNISVNFGNNQNGTAGSPLAGSLIAIVKDSNANPVSGVTVTWAVTAGGGSDSSCTTTTNSSGLVQCTFTTGTTAGTNTVTATASGIATPATFTETGTVGSAATIAVSSGNSLSATAGSAIASPLIAIVKDSNSNPVSGVTVTWAVTAGGGSDSSCTTTTNSSGLVQCTFTTGTTAGTNTITATASGIATPATFTETGTAGSATTIAVSSGNSLSATAGSAIGSPLVAVVKDSNSNPVSGVTVTWAVTAGGGSDSSCTTTSNSSGLVQCTFTTGTTTGTNTVTATASGIATPATFTETGSPGTLASIAFTTGPSASTTADATQTVAITEYDSHSNILTNDTGSAVTLAAYSSNNCTGTAVGSALSTTSGSTSSGVATFSSFGIYLVSVQSILATIGSKTACAGSLTVTTGATANITATSGSAQSANDGTALTNPLVATVTDDHSNPISGTTIVWAVTAGNGATSSCTSTTNSSGQVQCTYTMGIGSPGTNTITATIGGTSTKATFSETGNSASFNANWNFQTASQYSYNTSKIDFTNGYAELTPARQIDSSDATTGFGGGTATGIVWDGTNDYVRLTQTGTPTNNASLDSSWAPNWSTLVSYWQLENNWNDSAGSNTLTPAGAPSFTTSSKVGSYAASFGGTSDYASVGSAVLGTQVNNWTMSAWIFPTSLTTAKRIAVYTGTGGTNGFGIASSGSTAGQVAVEINGTWVEQSVSYAANTWQHVVAVRNGGTLTTYFNGVAQATTSTTAPTAPSAITYIGWDGTNSKMEGNVDEVAVWSTALSAAQVQLLYSRQSAKYAGTFTSRVMDGLETTANWTSLAWIPTLPFYKELPPSATSETTSSYPSLTDSTLMTGNVGLWHLDETSGTTTADSSGQGNNGTISGSITVGLQGKLSNAMRLNFAGTTGTEGFINIGDGGTGSALDSATQSSFTWSTWVNPIFPTVACGTNSSLCTGVIMGRQSNDSLNVTQTGTMRCSMENNSSVTFSVAASPSANTWHHLAMTVDPTNNLMHCYLDGTEMSGSPLTYTGTLKNESGTSYQLGVNDGGNALTNGNFAEYFTGMIDEVGVWNRLLSSIEIQQLYRRGANRVKYQLRSCPDSTCSTNPVWQGTDNTNQTYFSELNNTLANAATGAVQTGLPTMTFSDFGSLSVATNRYFQYRAIMESDDASTNCNYSGTATWCSPELTNVTAGPNHYDTSAPTITNNVGVPYASLTNLIETLQSAGCSSGTLYNLSPDNSHWYYWTGTAWGLASGTEANSASAIAAQLSTFATQVSSGTIYFKVFLQSSGATACAISNLEIQVTQ
jgi:hypothetical protein